MQCYERQAMYLKLYSDLVEVIPQLEFDQELLDDVLADYSIHSFSALVSLECDQRDEIVMRIRTDLGYQPVDQLSPVRPCNGTRKSATEEYIDQLLIA